MREHHRILSNTQELQRQINVAIQDTTHLNDNQAFIKFQETEYAGPSGRMVRSYNVPTKSLKAWIKTQGSETRYKPFEAPEIDEDTDNTSSQQSELSMDRSDEDDEDEGIKVDDINNEPPESYEPQNEKDTE